MILRLPMRHASPIAAAGDAADAAIAPDASAARVVAIPADRRHRKAEISPANR